jgi:anaerobic magnesium-protoporphyrin IX monomethyl ester cyclase
MRILFVEPPKDVWFVMGEYLAPPLGLLTLASYLEHQFDVIDIDVVDCATEKLDWIGLEKRMASFHPDIVAPSGLGTCNAYTVLRTVNLAKQIDPQIMTVVGGQHFSTLATESLESYPSLDVIIRGEGEQTLSELLSALEKERSLQDVAGLSFRNDGTIVHTPDRPLLCDLSTLPFPAYHYVEKHMQKYYFALMKDQDTPFGIIEGSRGCWHDCSYCSQWRFWNRTHRRKTAERIVAELEYLYTTYGTKFFWLADDNFTLDERVNDLCDLIIERGLNEEVTWFCQTRFDDIVHNTDLLPKMRRAGNIWMLTGFDNPNAAVLETFRRHDFRRAEAKEAVTLLRQHDIFSQGMFILGARSDSHDSIQALRYYADWLDPDIATFMTLTPFPGTDIYDLAKRNGWIENSNWSEYDMIHAIMPTEHLTREEVQQELYECYRVFFGNWKRRNRGLFSSNPIKKRTYLFLAKKAILTGLSSLFKY